MKHDVFLCIQSLASAGAERFVTELACNIDKTKFQVDVIIKDGDEVDEHMLSSLKSFGSNVFLAKGSFPSRMLQLRKYFKTHKNEYSVIHINATSQSTGIISYFAKKNGNIPKVIFHSHMGGNDNGKSIVDKVGTKLMLKHSDVFASCSNSASNFMFENKLERGKVIILNNSVDASKFAFNHESRQKIRDELKISDNDFVILHTGRFAPQKNHKQLILIFNELLKTEPNAKLLLIGDGVLLDETKELVNSLKIENSVHFLGLKNNVNDYMCAADCFVMPSIHEGLPIVSVESQASDLPCVLSTNVSDECKLTDSVKFVSLSSPLKDWVSVILKTKKHKRKSNTDLFKKIGFDESSAIKTIEKLYSNQGENHD